jgi:hypothetical protein
MASDAAWIVQLAFPPNHLTNERTLAMSSTSTMTLSTPIHTATWLRYYYAYIVELFVCSNEIFTVGTSLPLPCLELRLSPAVSDLTGCLCVLHASIAFYSLTQRRLAIY